MRLGIAASGILVASVLVARASAKAKARVVLLDTLAGDQVYPCGSRSIEGSTDQGVQKAAASFTVTASSAVTRVVLPLTVADRPARIKVTICAGMSWDGKDPANPGGIGSWDNHPDESVVLGSATATVRVLTTSCGPPDIVTVHFPQPVEVRPGVVYWVVVQAPAHKARRFQWVDGLSHSDDSAIAQLVSDPDGMRWIAYDPAAIDWRASAMRVVGTRLGSR